VVHAHLHKGGSAEIVPGDKCVWRCDILGVFVTGDLEHGVVVYAVHKHPQDCAIFPFPWVGFGPGAGKQKVARPASYIVPITTEASFLHSCHEPMNCGRYIREF